LSCWYLQTEIKLMKPCFEGVEKAPSEDGVIGIGHVYHIEGYVLSVGI
jgi:hypothetical protein